MTWTDMLRTEVTHLHAQEEDIVPTLEAIRRRASGAPTHEILLQMIEAAPARQGRLAAACAFAGWPLETRAPMVLLGWKGDVDKLVDNHPKGPTTDATILTLVMKITRMRTAGYEAAYLLAKNLAVDPLLNLLGPLWTEDRESDDRASDVLAALIRSSGADWDECFRLSQGE